MNELESSRHLYQPPLYRAADGTWHQRFADAVAHCGDRLTWDPAAILAILSFNFVCGDRTLVQEVTRRPWLSEIGLAREPRLEPIPGHDTLWLSTDRIADRLGQLLMAEALRVCRGRREIFILLTGGLDSRVVAGVLAGLIREGKLDAKPVAVTWGLADSRDVVYGRMLARHLGFQWLHVGLGPQDVVRNAEKTALSLSAMLSPQHLHGMLWFENAPEEALVLAASYGDSVGRAEFSSRHLLELTDLRPTNVCGLLKPAVVRSAARELRADFQALYDRAPGRPPYVLREHQQQGHYIRNMMGHCLALINEFCSIYQMFTHPDVYSFMWSIHPSLRSDEVYAHLLEGLDPALARMPWARTNRALRGRTEGAQRDARPRFHDYATWVRGPLYQQMRPLVDPDWFADTNLFDPTGVRRVDRALRSGADRLTGRHAAVVEVWLWLATFRRLADWLSERGKRVESPTSLSSGAPGPSPEVTSSRGTAIQYAVSRSTTLRKLAKATRRLLLMQHARLKYPPRKVPAKDP